MGLLLCVCIFSTRSVEVVEGFCPLLLHSIFGLKHDEKCQKSGGPKMIFVRSIFLPKHTKKIAKKEVDIVSSSARHTFSFAWRRFSPERTLVCIYLPPTHQHNRVSPYFVCAFLYTYTTTSIHTCHCNLLLKYHSRFCLLNGQNLKAFILLIHRERYKSLKNAHIFKLM